MTTDTQVMEVTTQNILDPKSALGRMLEKLGRIDYKVKPEEIDDLKTRSESVIQSGKKDKDTSKLANAIRLEARRHRLDVQNDFKLAKDTVKEIVAEISTKVKERGETLIASLADIETPLQAIEDTFEANKKAEAEKVEADRQKKIRERFDALGKVNAKFDYVAIQTMSDEAYNELLASSTAEFEKAEAVRLEREQAEQQAEQARQAKAAIGRGRAGELAQLGDIVAPEVAAEWDETVFSCRRDDAMTAFQKREEVAKEARESEARLKDRAKQLTPYSMRPDLDFLATCSEDEFTAILESAKADFEADRIRKEQEEREASARRDLAKVRFDRLAPVGGGFGMDTLGNMSEEEFESVFESKKAKHDKAIADKAQADADAVAKAETERLAAEKKRQEEIELARPDVEKLVNYLDSIKVEPPTIIFQSEEAVEILMGFSGELFDLISETKTKAANLIAK